MSAPAVATRRFGPSALGDDVRRFWNLTWTLAVTEFKLRFFGSALGYLWTLMRPLLFFGVLYLVFTKVAKLGHGVKDYPVYLLASIVLFTYFGEVTGGCVTSLVNRESLLRKIRFPRLVIPMSVALTSLFNLGMNLIAVFIFAIASGDYPRLSWLWLIPLVALLVLVASGAGMLLSALYVRFRDIAPIWDVVTQALFYASPILYTVQQFHGLQRVAMANPIAVVTTQMRHAVIDSSAPTAGAAIGGELRLALPLGIVAVVFALGFWVFNREAPRIAENL
jgi:ABC-2 type transport system permease protein